MSQIQPSDHKKLVYVLNYVSADDTQHFVHVLHLLTKLKQLGWSVVVISEKGGEGTKTILGHDVRYMSQNGKWSRMFRLGWTLAKLRREGYRLVFVRISKPAALLATLLSRPLGWKTLYWLSGAQHDFNEKKPLVERAVEAAIMRTIITCTHRFVTGPETMVRYYEAIYRVPREKITLLYNDIDVERFKCDAAMPASSGDLSVLLLHRLSPFRETIRYMPAIIRSIGEYATEQNRTVRLDIVGDGPERAMVEAAAAKAFGGLKVVFHGAVPNRRVREFYGQADVFIMPSYREGFPRVIVEAMAMGLPIVTTDAGGTRDLFGSRQQDFVIPRDNAELFGRQIKALLADPEKRREFGMENVREVQRFSADTVAQMYNDALLSVLSDQGLGHHPQHV